MDTTNIYRTLYSNTKEDIFWALHRILYKVDYILMSKVSLNRYKKIEVTLWNNILSDTTIKAGYQQQDKKTESFTVSWKVSNKLLNQKWMNTGVRKEINDFLELNENEETTYPT